MPLINTVFSGVGFLLVIYGAYRFFQGDSETSEMGLAIMFGIGVLMILVTGGPSLLGPFVDWNNGDPVVVRH